MAFETSSDYIHQILDSSLPLTHRFTHWKSNRCSLCNEPVEIDNSLLILQRAITGEKKWVIQDGYTDRYVFTVLNGDQLTCRGFPEVVAALTGLGFQPERTDLIGEEDIPVLQEMKRRVTGKTLI